MSKPKENTDVQLPYRNHQNLCIQCKLKRVHKNRKSKMCPDCAADNRRIEVTSKSLREK